MVDAYAWIEYLDGSEAGERVRDIVEDESNLVYSAAVTVAEVVSKFLRRNMNPEIAYKAMTTLTRIVKVDAETSKAAGTVHAEMRKHVKDFGLTDACVLAISRKLNARIVTGDPHFSALKGIIFIK